MLRAPPFDIGSEHYRGGKSDDRRKCAKCQNMTFVAPDERQQSEFQRPVECRPSTATFSIVLAPSGHTDLSPVNRLREKSVFSEVIGGS